MSECSTSIVALQASHSTLAADRRHKPGHVMEESRRNTRESRGIGALPEEVLQQVSEHLSLRQWAQAAGTCRKLRELPLMTVSLSCTAEDQRRITPEGIVWAVKRCQAAQVLRCNLEDLSVSSMHQIWPLLAACRNPGLPNLQELHLLLASPDSSWRKQLNCSELFGSHKASTAPKHIEYSTAFFEYILQCCAFHAQLSLRVLLGHVPSLVPGLRFPVMRGLKHVILAVEQGEGLSELVDALPLMHQLETLHLSHRPGSYARTPALDLSTCRNLQQVWLGGIAPAELTLVSASSLHLDLYSLDLACEPVWASLSSVHALYISCAEMGSGISCQQPLALLSGSVELNTVYLENWDFGDAPGVSASLANARHLNVCGHEILLHIPAANKWETLEVFAWGYLALEFEDRDAFIRAPPACTFEFTGTMGLGVWDFVRSLDQLWQMQVRGRGIADARSLNHLCNRCSASSLSGDCCCNLEEQQKLGAAGRFAGRPITCDCGACARCLISTGKISSSKAVAE